VNVARLTREDRCKLHVSTKLRRSATRVVKGDAGVLPASYPCKECSENVPGYAAGGGSGAGRSAEGELGCPHIIWIGYTEICTRWDC